MKDVKNFFAGTDLVVTGYNPENADFVNPRGAIFGSASYVYAENKHGDRVRLYVKTDYSDAVALAAAERLASALNARLAAGKLPVAFDRWDQARPGYGTVAWQQYGEYDEIMLERREAEEESFQ